MTLTPVEIRHIKLSRRLLGYQRSGTDRLLEEIVESFEEVWRSRADYADKIEQLETELVRYRELEALLRTTLISAERASHELKDQARRESELVLTEAHAEARRITREAIADRERLAGEARRIKTQLASALATLGPEIEEAARSETPEVEAA